MSHTTKEGLPVRILEWAPLCKVQAEDGRIFWMSQKYLTQI